MDLEKRQKFLEEEMQPEVNRAKLEEIMFSLDDGVCNFCGKKLKKGKIFCNEDHEIEYRRLENKVKLWE